MLLEALNVGTVLHSWMLAVTGGTVVTVLLVFFGRAMAHRLKHWTLIWCLGFDSCGYSSHWWHQGEHPTKSIEVLQKVLPYKCSCVSYWMGRSHLSMWTVQYWKASLLMTVFCCHYAAVLKWHLLQQCHLTSG